MADRESMPRRGDVDPAFDGHLERPLLELSAEERLEWIWATMCLLRAAKRRDRSPTHGGPTPASE